LFYDAAATITYLDLMQTWFITSVNASFSSVIPHPTKDSAFSRMICLVNTLPIDGMQYVLVNISQTGHVEACQSQWTSYLFFVCFGAAALLNKSLASTSSFVKGLSCRFAWHAPLHRF
jgi:hypothetical protein